MKKVLASVLGAAWLMACNNAEKPTGPGSASRPNELKSAASTATWHYNITTAAKGNASLGVSSMAGNATDIFMAYGYNATDAHIVKKSNADDNDQVAIGGPNYNKVQGMATLNGQLYVCENGRIVKVNNNDGSYTWITGQLFDKTQSMTATNKFLYLVHDDRLWRVDPANNGQPVQLGGPVWKYTGGMAYNPNDTSSIYIVENGYINKVKVSDGTYTKLGGQLWQGCRGMAYLNDNLYLLFGKNLYRVDLNGNYENIARNDVTCCGSDVVRNAITASGNSIYYWSAQGSNNCDTSIGVCYSDGNCWKVPKLWCNSSSDPWYYIIRVTPSLY